jgi:allophanate hydrolase
MSSTALPELAAPSERVRRAYSRIAAASRPEAWIHLRHEDDALADAGIVERRLQAGESLPLAGVTVSVKDNVDVRGLPTTAGCPAFAYRAREDAPAVARLRRAGAIVLGKGNLDQFATGLTGTRSPYGKVGGADDPERAGGGSSSGSALAVALGMADLGLITDTAGSGRVPAALQGIVAIKPTRGLVPARGVVPACRSFDCVGVFAAELDLAALAIHAIAGFDDLDPRSRRPPAGRPSSGQQPRVAFVAPERLELISTEARGVYADYVERLARAAGTETVEIDLEPFLAAGRLLYGGAFLAERYAAVGSFIEHHRGEVDEIVAEIILAGGSITAARYVADVEQLGRLKVMTARALRGVSALVLPTAPFQPTLAAVAADPVGINEQLGTYTTFANPLDLCAVALPGGEADGGPFGVSLLAPAFHEDVAIDLAGRLRPGAPARA